MFEQEFQRLYADFLHETGLEPCRDQLIPIVQAAANALELEESSRETFSSWKVTLFNPEKHALYPHQVKATQGCVSDVVLSEKQSSGYCFMPTSGGKGHVLMTLAGLAISEYFVHRHIAECLPDVWQGFPQLHGLYISLGLHYSRVYQATQEPPRVQILVHDKEILKQIETDCQNLLGLDLKRHIEFFTVQAHRNPSRSTALRYVIIDECHWGNASEEETLQSRLVEEVTRNAGKAFGFTASPYQEGKFQRTWSNNALNADLDFNYYLDKGVLYPVTLREVNLQNARADFAETHEEIDLTEKDQVIDFMANHILATIPGKQLDGPAICFFSNIIIPDLVGRLFEKCPELRACTKVLGSETAKFTQVCADEFGPRILATENDIEELKRGRPTLLVSRQKLLVGFNAPHLRYCFISPTNSRITIMQAIGRLMRPIASETVPKKIATLFLTSVSGKKLDIGGKGAEDKDENNDTQQETPDPLGEDTPKTRYTTTSMTLSEAYSLRHPVFYKTEVGFKDFINETRIRDGNTVEFVKRDWLNPDDLENINPISRKQEISRLRDLARAQYRNVILKRDSRVEHGRHIWCCQGKVLLGAEKGCDRTETQVNLEIHHKPPHSFIKLLKELGPDGVLEWHRNTENFKHLITLCTQCHDLAHTEEVEDLDGSAA